MMQRCSTTLTAAAALICLALAFPAQSPAQLLGPCQKDADRFCKDVTPGQGRVVYCLKAYEDKLSPECTSYVEKLKAEAEARFNKAKTNLVNWQKACHQDAKKLCAGIPYGDGRIMDCLKEHIDQVSPACRGAVNK